MVIDESLWRTGQPNQFSPARIYFTERKLQTAVGMSGARRGAKVLEVGCTSGMFTFAMQRLGFDVTGFDLDEGAVEIARGYAKGNSLENIQFETGDAHDLSRFADDTFDHVFSFQSYRYFQDLDKALREVHRVLKPGGVTGIDYPNRFSPYYLVYKKLKGHDYKFPDYNYLSEREAVARHERIGFRSVTARTLLFTPPTTPAPLLPLMKGLDRGLESVPWINALAGIVMVAAKK